MNGTINTNQKTNKRLRIFTWHVHGSYLYYLTQANCEFYLPIKPGRPEGYGGRAGAFTWGDNVYEIAADKVAEMEFDCILFQSQKNYLEDQYEILSPIQRELPKIYLEHDPPREHPTDTRHVVDDPSILLVHVTHFNALMWDSGKTPTTVIEHGVTLPPDVQYTGEKKRGIVVINNIADRGRRLGFDIFEKVRQHIPLDIAGMGSEEIGGLGEIPHIQLPQFISHYRFLFNPIRYTSLGLSVCEAMMLGMPIVGLATTEMPIIIDNDISGFIHTDMPVLIDRMDALLQDVTLARRISFGAKTAAQQRFGINRFTHDWERVFTIIADKNKAQETSYSNSRSFLQK